MRVIVGALAVALLAGCAFSDAKQPTGPVPETDACMTYRAMMTAPMPPDAHERLRLACERSRAKSVE